MTSFTRGVLGLKAIPQRAKPFVARNTRASRESMREINQQFKDVISHLETESQDAVRYALEPMLDKALYYVPKDTMALAESAYMETALKQGQVIAEIGFGKPTASASKPGRLRPADYAALIHERPDLNHDAPTRFKYLQTAMQEHMGEIPERVAEFLRGVFK